MNPGRYFMPNMAINPMMIRNGYAATRGMGLFSRLTQGLRSFNWSKLLTGANRTLNVMNQTIPLIRQAKPMVGNVKNMLHLAKAFRNETSSAASLASNKQFVNGNKKLTVNNNNISGSSIAEKSNHKSDLPTFFI